MLRNQKRPGSGQLKSTGAAPGASRMSALGQKQTFAAQKGMSALPQKRTCAVQLGMSALCQ